MSEEENFDIVRDQLVRGCDAIHAAHGYQNHAARDCHAPEADAALMSIASDLEDFRHAALVVGQTDPLPAALVVGQFGDGLGPSERVRECA
jgi:hypothetical protein